MRKVIETILVILIILVVVAFTIKYCNERANEKAEQERLERIETTKQLAIQTKIRIKDVEAQLKSIPASKVALNLRLYKELHELDPDNPRYIKKIEYYQARFNKEKIAEMKRKEEREAEISKLKIIDAVEYKRLIQTALNEGVFCKVWMTENYIRIHVTRIFNIWTFTAKTGACEMAMRAYPGHKGVLIYDCYTNKEIGFYGKYGLKMK